MRDGHKHNVNHRSPGKAILLCEEFKRRGYTAVRDLVQAPRHICGRCSRATRLSEHLCDPRPLEVAHAAGDAVHSG